MKYGSVCSGVECAHFAFRNLGWECQFVAQVEPFPCAVLQQRLNATPPIHPLDPYENGIDEKERKQRISWLKQINKMPQIGTLPNEGDFTKIGKKYEGKIDVLIGGTPCFASGAMVLTPNGYVPIETLQIGDTVVSHNGNICKVIDVGFKLAKTGLAHVVGRDPIRCTGNHPFYSASVKRDYRRKSTTYGQYIVNGDFEFIPIENSVNRYVGRISINTAKDFVDNFIVSNLTRELTLLIAGYYVGDGYIRHYKEKNKKQVIIALVDKKKIEKFNEFFNEKINYSVGKDGKIIISNTALADWLIANFGEHSLQKHIPLWLYNDKDKIFFLEGYKNTDGHQINDNSYKITTVSSALAYGVADLQGSSTVHIQKVLPTKKIDDRIINQHDYYNVVTNKNSDKTKFFNDRYASKIKGWENDGIITKVYNITVERDNSYIVNGLSVHNCQSFSVAGKREGLAGVSGLALDFIKLAYESRAKWIIWQNVPGALTTADGRDFAAFLSGLTGCGVTPPKEGWGNAGFVPNGRRDRYGVAWRILDAQFTRTPNFPYAVPQRRRRIFLIGYLGDWRRAAQVLFERASLFGYPAPCRKTQQEIAEDVRNCTSESGGNCNECTDTVGRRCIRGSRRFGDGEVSINGNTSRDSVLKENIICKADQQGHSQSMENCCPTISAMAGMSGNNQPFFVKESDVNIEVNFKDKCFLGDGTDTGDVAPTLQACLSKMINNQNPIIHENNKCYNITTCDANGTRKDRPNGGMYVNETEISNTISTNIPTAETVVVNEAIAIDQQGGKGSANYAQNVCMTLCSDSHGTPHAVCEMQKNPKCFQQNIRNEVRFINGDGSIAGTVSAESGSHQQNYIVLNGGTVNDNNDMYVVDMMGSKNSANISDGKVCPTIATTHNDIHVICRNEKKLKQNSDFNVNHSTNEQIICYTKSSKPKNAFEAPTYKQAEVSNTLNCFENNHDGRAVELIVSNKSIVGADQYNLEITEDVVSTLGINCGMSLGRKSIVEVYSLDSKESNSMKSSNPNSGFHKTEVSKTIDTSIPEPSKNQGGIAIVEIEKDEDLLF